VGGGAGATLRPRGLAAEAWSAGTERESRLARGGEDGALSWGAGGGRRDGVEVGIEEGNPRIVYIYIVICGTHMS
jgi:hypothetical protein